MDKKLVNQLLVGIFVTIAFLGFIFVLFNISGGDGLFTRKATLIARFKHVKGLHYGSEVSLAGLRVGVVRSIEISQDDPKTLVAYLSIQRKMMSWIRKDSVASVKTQGVLGDKYVEISLGSPTEPILNSGDEIPVVEETDLISKGSVLVDEVKRQFQKGGDVEMLIKNLSEASAKLYRIINDIKTERGLLYELVYGKSGARLAESIHSIGEILKRIERGDGTLGLLINDPGIYEDIKRVTGNMSRSNLIKSLIRSFGHQKNETEAQK